MTTQTLRQRTMRRVAAASATSVLLVGLTACSGDDDAADANEEPSAAESSQTTDGEAADPVEESTAETETADVAAGEEVDTDEFVAMYQAGVEALTTASVTSLTSLAGTDVKAEGDVDYTSDPASMTMKMDMGAAAGGGKIDMRVVDEMIYMNMGALSQNKFIKIDLSDPNGPMGDMSALTESMDPVSAFDQFSEGVDKVVFVGEEEVDGEALDHYELTVDTTKIDALKDMGGEGAAADIPDSITYDMWLDDESRMRQVKTDLMGTDSTTTISDFGKDVDIKAPSASQITKLPGM